MAENSLFAILMRSPWWISLVIAAVLGGLGAALLPEPYKVGGALSGAPFIVIAALAARRQWHLPSAARVTQTQAAVSAMGWPQFAQLLQQAFERDGYSVQRGKAAPVDFELARAGRRTLVSARRWKSARTGLDALRLLQTARETDDASEALHVGLGELSDNARAFATQHGMKIWQTAELAQSLRGLALALAPTRPK